MTCSRLNRASRDCSPRGKRDEARATLAEIYNRFIGGFDTADLKDAKARLGEPGKKKGVVPAATR